jgi:hypothetical protein
MSLDIYVSAPKCPTCGHSAGRLNVNITYNLSQMWREAGFDDRACDAGRAGDIVPNVKEAIATLRASPARFEAMNPENGWGSYGGLIIALEELLRACEAHPDYELSTWR